jgi:hypothetical protein
MNGTASDCGYRRGEGGTTTNMRNVANNWAWIIDTENWFQNQRKKSDKEGREAWKDGKTKTYVQVDRLCGLVVRVPGYRSRAPG